MSFHNPTGGANGIVYNSSGEEKQETRRGGGQEKEKRMEYEELTREVIPSGSR
jgi:hypothetical protein